MNNVEKLLQESLLNVLPMLENTYKLLENQSNLNQMEMAKLLNEFQKITNDIVSLSERITNLETMNSNNWKPSLSSEMPLSDVVQSLMTSVEELRKSQQKLEADFSNILKKLG